MKLFLPRKKACLLIPSGPAGDLARKHLFILLCDPVTMNEVVLVATISSVKEGRWHDPTCIIEPGTHRFITKQSFVDYSRTTVRSVEKLENGVQEGTFVPDDPIDDELLERILTGLMESPFTPKGMVDFYTTNVL